VTIGCVAIVVSAAPRAPAADLPPFGVASLSTAVGGDQAAYDADANAVKSVGANWIRINVLWHKVEPSPGVFEWEAIDKAVQAGTAASLQILAVISGPAPVWAQGPGTDPLANGSLPASPDTFGAFARALAVRYSTAIKAWEIWNEPNIPHYFQPVDVGEYVSLLRAAYESIHAVQRDATVLSGGLSSTNTGIAANDFLDQMYALGAKPYLNAVALHPYTFPNTVSDDPSKRFEMVGRAYASMVRNGDGEKKIWITEYGQATGTSPDAVDENKQADVIIDFMRRVSGVRYLGPSFIFTTHDIGTDPSVFDFNFGLFRSDFTEKTVVARLRQLAGRPG